MYVNLNTVPHINRVLNKWQLFIVFPSPFGYLTLIYFVWFLFVFMSWSPPLMYKLPCELNSLSPILSFFSSLPPLPTRKHKRPSAGD